jgi:hypothetical protein
MKDASAGGMDAQASGCTSNKECMEGSADRPARCRADGTCVVLETEECPQAFGDASDPNAIFFGAFATLDPATPVEDNAIVRAQNLALEELSGDNVGGLPGGPRGARRPLVMLVCNNDTPDHIDAAMSHLADEVQVPALLATLTPGDMRRAFEAHRDRDIFFLSPVAATSVIVGEDDRPPGAESGSAGLIWTMLGQPSKLAPAYAAILHSAEKYVKGYPEVNGRAIRLALVTTTKAFDSELGDFVAQALVFNGKSTADNGSRYLAVTVDDSNPIAPDGGSTLDQLSQHLVDFRPDIVVSTASEAFTQNDGVFQYIEVHWEDGLTSDQRRPFYILSPFNAGDLSGVQKLLGDLIDGRIDATANRRVIGVEGAGAPDETLQNAFAARLMRRFGNVNVESGNYYDSTYFLAYAMYGAEGSLTGSSIADGMLQLLHGQAFGVGPDDITNVFKALGDPATTIELDGTLGPPDFDVATGTRIDNGSIYCFDDSMLQGLTLRSEVLRYDPSSGQFTGSFPCIPGFYP